MIHMPDALAGDIVIDGNTVRYSDRVGSRVTVEQESLLLRTADKLGKFAVQDRYPTSSFFAHGIEMLYASNRPCFRNEHGVPEQAISDDFQRYLRNNGW